MQQNVHIAYNLLEEACRKWSVEKVLLFGSAVRDDFTGHSDIDLLLDFKEGVIHSLFTYDRMCDDFRRAFDRNVDLVNLQGLLASRNQRRKHHILSEARELYVLQS